MSKLKTDVDYFFLHPGSIVITGNKIPVMTILGSCIALVAFSSKHKVGCMFHALLPEHVEKIKIIKNAPPVSPNADYVDYAFYYVRERLRQKGIELGEMKIMLFGGGDVLVPLCYNGQTVGSKNIEKIKEIINREKLKIYGEDTGGIKGRKIIFYPDSGKIYFEYIA